MDFDLAILGPLGTPNFGLGKKKNLFGVPQSIFEVSIFSKFSHFWSSGGGGGFTDPLLEIHLQIPSQTIMINTMDKKSQRHLYMYKISFDSET